MISPQTRLVSVLALVILIVLAGCGGEATTKAQPAENIDETHSEEVELEKAPPQEFTGTPVWQNRIELNWSLDNDEVRGFELSRRITAVGGWTRIATLPKTINQYNDTVLTGVSYDYRLVAVYEGGESEPVEATDLLPQSSKPTNLTAVRVDSGSIALSWDTAAYATALHVERRPNGGSFLLLDSLSADATAYIDASFKENEHYTYRLVASNGSDAAASAVTAITVPPAPPSSFKAQPVRADTIRLTWAVPVSSAVTHDLYRQPAGAGDYQLIAGIAAGDTSYDDIVAKETAYDYRLVAVSMHGESAPSAALDVATVPNQAVELIVTELPDVAFKGESVNFVVTASDPDLGDRVTLRWLDPAPGCRPTTFTPREGIVSERIRCKISPTAGASQRFTFLAHDDYAPEAITRTTVSFQTAGPSSLPAGTWVGDVTGNGIDDLVTISSFVTAGLPPQIHVWAGGAVTETPTATIMLTTYDNHAHWRNERVALGDVTGNGILDIVVIDILHREIFNSKGVVRIYAGGASLVGNPEPLATLSHSADLILPGYSEYAAQALRLGDVTGNGIKDVLITATSASFLTQPFYIYLWEGGPGLTGTVETATELKGDGTAYFFLARVMGNETWDVVSRGTSNVEIWEGGAFENGSLSPTVTLEVPTLPSGVSPGMRLADVTGDGATEVLLHGPDGIRVYRYAEFLLSGTTAPSATLAAPSAEADLDPEHFYIEDVTGDGILDVIVASTMEPNGDYPEEGAVYVFAGGSDLTGEVAPTATLRRTHYDFEPGEYAPTRMPGEIFFGDVIGDGHTDIVVFAPEAEVATFVSDTGSPAGMILVWEGGPQLAGMPPAANELTLPSTYYVRLGSAFGGPSSIVLVDATGNGRADILASFERHILEFEYPDELWGYPTDERSGIAIWEGGTTIDMNPTVRISLPEPSNHHLAVGDLNGDGIDDIILGNRLWLGGDTLAGTITEPTQTWPELPATTGSEDHQFHQFVHIFNNEPPALVLWNPYSNGNRGSMHIVNGATLEYEATLSVVGASEGDKLGHVWSGPSESIIGGGHGLRFGDFIGDGNTHILGVTPSADVDDLSNAGAVYFWNLAEAFSGMVEPTATFADPITDQQFLGLGPYLK